MAMRHQRAQAVFAARRPDVTMLRSVWTAMIRVAPSSVASRTIASSLSPLPIPWKSVIGRRGRAAVGQRVPRCSARQLTYGEQRRGRLRCALAGIEEQEHARTLAYGALTRATYRDVSAVEREVARLRADGTGTRSTENDYHCGAYDNNRRLLMSDPFADIALLVIDIDGTLTDAKLGGAAPEIGWTQVFSVRDGESIRRLCNEASRSCPCRVTHALRPHPHGGSRAALGLARGGRQAGGFRRARRPIRGAARRASPTLATGGKTCPVFERSGFPSRWPTLTNRRSPAARQVVTKAPAATTRMEEVIDLDSRGPWVVVVIAVGVMSGTSADGVDAVMIELASAQARHDAALSGTRASRLPGRSARRSVRTDELKAPRIAELSFTLARRYAAAVRALSRWRRALGGRHARTEPFGMRPPPRRTPARCKSDLRRRWRTWLGVPVVGDLRGADVALGGQGAPNRPFRSLVFHPAARYPALGGELWRDLQFHLRARARGRSARRTTWGPG